MIIYLAEKYNLKIPNIMKYSKDGESISKQIYNDRMTAKKILILISNEGFSDEYHTDKNINTFLKKLKKNRKFYINVFKKLIKE